MKINYLPSLCRSGWVFALFLGFCPFSLSAATQVESNGIVWTFEEDRPAGQYITGDPWVVGPVKVTGIGNKLNSPSYKARPGQNGSMLNPGGTAKQGYDDGLASYDASLNAGLVNGEPVSASAPLVLPPGSSLVSAASWLYHSAEDREPGCPKFGGGANAPRPAIRSAGILTVVDKEPPSDAFRPPYCGSDKTPKFTRAMLDYGKLPKLAAVPEAPDCKALENEMARPWVDHVNAWLGAHVHPSEHMPNYGRDLGRVVAHCTLVLFLDPAAAGENPAKDKVLVNLVQFGIDCAGIADVGGGWPSDGGHGMGRKWPILFAGAVLNDPHMLDVGNWKTDFQENMQTFYVSQAEVDITNGPSWNPDKRAPTLPYTVEDIGMAEWGIRHAREPQKDNKDWRATYREVNGAVIPAYALAARLMNLEQAWNHKAFFDYCERYMKWLEEDNPKLANTPSNFLRNMWKTYWKPETKPTP